MNRPPRKPVGFGVLGLGSFVAQKAVIPAIRGARNARLVALSTTSQTPANFKVLEQETVYGDYRMLLDNDEVEVVYLPLPNDLHLDFIERAVLAGKHVLCEKPILVDVHRFRELRELSKASGLIISEAFMTAYHPRSKQVLQLIQGGGVGHVLSINSTFTGTLSPLSGYRVDPARGGGSLWDVGIYALHPVLEILGATPASILVNFDYAFDPPVDLSASVYLEFGPGQSAHVLTSFRAGETQRLEVVGSEASLIMERACTPGVADTTALLTDASGVTSILEFPGVDPYAAMIESISNSVRDAKEPEWTLSRAEQIARLISAIHDSAGQVAE